ncbi:hypothetical protein ZIOFF_012721 [Zingiber officinale]|uniref:J domain-containing protein n=1 Tax=Zingiber officinale TaxID=94328 RepID=A0A8J5I8I2_ZINOF|nr:hypothetical protein ZIOFF_012721 [Zingiber officinale]
MDQVPPLAVWIRSFPTPASPLSLGASVFRSILPQRHPLSRLRFAFDCAAGSSRPASLRWSWSKRQRGGPWRRAFPMRASRRESPYEVLGVSPSSSPREIKRAYRRLALKYHPDVNKEANAQKKFMRIKHAYNTLMNSESQSKYGNQSGDFSRTAEKRSDPDEEFYGFGEFFKDVQISLGINSQEAPKSLWEELSAIGEEFVEFLEKELNISDLDTEKDSSSDEYQNGNPSQSSRNEKSNKEGSIEDSIEEIEETLAQLKKELGL